MINFNYSVSSRKYNRNTDANKTQFIQWIEKEGNINDLRNDILNENALCACFHHSGNTFNNTLKKENNFKSTNLIIFDLDAVKYNVRAFKELMEQSEIMPNVIYTTCNNGKFKKESEEYNNRYRVIYIIDTKIKDSCLYKQIHQNIKNEIRLITNDDNVYNDNTDANVSHFFAGNKDTIIYLNNEEYNTKWLIDRYNIIEESENKKSIIQLHNREEGKRSIIEMYDTFSDNIILRDYNQMTFKDFLNKYVEKFVNYEGTPIEFDENEMICYLPSDYKEIKRIFTKEHIRKNNGKFVDCVKVAKIKNGNNRRKKLFLNLLLRKSIYPQITFENLLYNAVYEMVYYIDNTDEKDMITKKQILKICLNAFKNENRIRDINKKTYKVNKRYCEEHGITARQGNIIHLNEQRMKNAEERNNQINELYNNNLKDMENLTILKENGIEISMATLKRWKKANGLTKSYKSAKTNYKERERNIIHYNCTFEETINNDSVSKVENINNQPMRTQTTNNNKPIINQIENNNTMIEEKANESPMSTLNTLNAQYVIDVILSPQNLNKSLLTYNVAKSIPKEIYYCVK
jgi:hypothetical protein